MADPRITNWFVAIEAVRAALGSIRAHALRSFLTTLGIVISVASIMYSQFGQSRIRYGSQTALAFVLGTTYSFQDIGRYYSRHGRFLSDSDNRTCR